MLSVLGLVSLAGAMSGVPMAKVSAATLVMLVTQTAVGTAFLVRVAALAAAFALGLRRRNSRGVMAGAALCAAIALGSLARSGHGVMDDGRAGVVHLLADIVHLLAAGVWVGALVSLLGLVRAAGKTGADSSAAHGALAGFASFGSASVALVLITGLVNSWLLVGPANVLTLGTARYGQLLMLKLALFVGMLWLAALNRLRLTPALGAAVTPGAVTAATRRLRVSLTLETVAAALILGLVAWLGSLEPPAALL
jgi:putative copper resistance protein D